MVYFSINRIFIYRILPTQRSLTLHNTSQLFINLEGCVNSLRGECMDFLHYYGRDGENNTAQSRYPCFYNKVMMIIYYYMSHDVTAAVATVAAAAD